MKARSFAWALLFFCSAAYTQEKDSEERLLLEGMNAYVAITEGPYVLELADDVTDGCMPSPSTVEQAWEVELRRLGYSIVPVSDEKESAFSPKIVIEVFGLGTSERSCAITVQTSLELTLGGILPYTDKMTISRNRIPLMQHMLSGAKTDMGERISHLSREHVNGLYLMMERTKERFRKEYPQFLVQYLTGKKAAAQTK